MKCNFSMFHFFPKTLCKINGIGSLDFSGHFLACLDYIIIYFLRVTMYLIFRSSVYGEGSGGLAR